LTRENRPEAANPERRLSSQEMERFTECVLPYLDAAHNLARYLVRDPHEAEEAVQEAFLRAIRHFDGFRGADGRAWLLSIVRNTCFTRLRRQRADIQNVEFDEEIHSPQEKGSGPEADLTSATTAESVREGLNQLPVEYREVLVLRELEGLSYKEIAHVAGVPIGTVMSRLARGRRQLLVALRADAKEND
jgi:RNA polymerase sigma-70 factor (ECF subfamily)